MKKRIFALYCVFVLLAFSGPALAAQVAKDVSFETADGVKIAATYYAGERGKPGIVLLHQLSRNRSDWRSFAFKCQEKGYSVLAIDLRGHGQSVEGKNGKKLDFQKFTDTDYGNMAQDVAAAVKWLLKESPANADKIGIAGASIGANQALVYAASGQTPVKTVMLLSPGTDYRGINITAPARKYTGSSLWIAMTADDYSATTVKELSANTGGNAVPKIYSGRDHGTNMFKNPDVEKLLLDWMAKNLE